MKKVTTARVPRTWTFCYRGTDGARLQVRVDDRPREVTALEAAEMSVAVMHAGGILCGKCLTESPIRYVLTNAPTVALCWDCYDRTTTTGAHY